VVLALVGVIAVDFVLRAMGRFFFPSATSRGQSRVVEVLSRSALAPKQQVMLLRIGRRVIVVGDSGTQMNTLVRFRIRMRVAGLVGQLREEKTATAAAFTSLFGRFNRRFGGEEEEREESGAASELRDDPEEPPVSSARGELTGCASVCGCWPSSSVRRGGDRKRKEGGHGGPPLRGQCFDKGGLNFVVGVA